MHRFVKNTYRDSVSLMRFADQIAEQAGVTQAGAVMGTESNINLLVDMGLLSDVLPAQPNDVLLVVEVEDDADASTVLDEAVSKLNAAVQGKQKSGVQQVKPQTIAMACQSVPDANLVLISTPGDYAAAEAMKALKQGLNVMIFSDNVSFEEEVRLKIYARQQGLLCMGPDCGTAIINGAPLGFANVIRSGDVGLIGASGTGLQQVSCLIDRLGGGISQVIGVGSHDLSEGVGGTTMLMAMEALADDTNTSQIVLISKPPAQSVAEKILTAATQIDKPVITCFIAADVSDWQQDGVRIVDTLEAAAYAAMKQTPIEAGATDQVFIEAAASALPPHRKYLRGLFSGGTLCYESLFVLKEHSIYSNTPIDKAYQLDDPWQSREHTAVDLGDDAFTIGRPHPMIDLRLRNERILEEASDPETAVILLDVVLGYGAHPDPASELAPMIAKAQEASSEQITFIASVCGTNADPQSLQSQSEQLRAAGVFLAESNAHAARLARQIITRANQ